jgi:hypothetical protein
VLPSMIATQLLVVPRSMPMILDIVLLRMVKMWMLVNLCIA